MTEDFYFLRPTTGERILVGQRPVLNPQEKIFTQPPRLGLVISTFGSVPYVALGLAVRQKLYPTLPVLVHDDASDQRDELARLCEQHGVDFQTNSARLGHEMGDVASLVGGLRWAADKGIELLARMTRRFIPLRDWTGHLAEVALATQFGTYGRECKTHRLPIRTECLAMYVRDWALPGIAGQMAEFAIRNRASIVVERKVYDWAGRVYELNCGAAREWERLHVQTTPRRMFCEWEFVEPERARPTPNYLWHDVNPPADYASLARQTGLNFSAAGFAAATIEK
jgi:hypothetical protein